MVQYWMYTYVYMYIHTHTHTSQECSEVASGCAGRSGSKHQLLGSAVVPSRCELPASGACAQRRAICVTSVVGARKNVPGEAKVSFGLRTGGTSCPLEAPARDDDNFSLPSRSFHCAGCRTRRGSRPWRKHTVLSSGKRKQIDCRSSHFCGHGERTRSCQTILRVV